MEGCNLTNHRDPSSFSQPDEVVVTHMCLTIEIDFHRKVLKGDVLLEVERIEENIQILVLDSKDLTISKVVNVPDDEHLSFTLNDPLDIFGSKLVIKLPDYGNQFNIRVYYECSPNASALKWLTPEQTVGLKHPYVFSQCQPIHCRSIIPCQDTPSVKITFSAQITVYNDLVVLMSAERKGFYEIEDGKRVYQFEQDVPIPTYLIAIVAGALEKRNLGHRTSVWSEIELVDKAAYEFADTEIMLKTAEQICGPYIWGVFELVVLPPSFPYGGMENPCLTFLSPTLLVGDRSLSNAVAHELAHSWTGNLVTPSTFEHFWLSEGFTTFIERKILGRLYGEPTRHFCALTGLKELEQQIKTMEYDSTKLVIKLVNPDKAISLVPYEKGHTFLFYLEELVGGRIAFDRFLKEFLRAYKFMSITTKDFKRFFKDYFSGLESIKEVNWSLWLNKPGMPPVIPKYNTVIENPSTHLAEQWIHWDMKNTSPFTEHDLDYLSCPQIQAFLIHLLGIKDLCVKKVKYMKQLYYIDAFHNSEIQLRWLLLCIKVRWSSQIEEALCFVNELGRIKFLLPIYKSLYDWPEAKGKIMDNFEKHRFNMMDVSEQAISKILNLN